MLTFIIAFALVLGTIMGLRTSYTATTAGETIADARMHGLVGGALVAWLSFCALMLLWGLGGLYWWIITLPGAY